MELITTFDHFNFNVADLNRSLAFYKKALNLTECRRKVADDNSFILVFLSDARRSGFQLELTWLRDRKEPYNLGECEYHLALRVDGNYDEVRRFHKEMGCVSYENEAMGIYFITDPDGYWIEVLPPKSGG
jgi:lactoylglutathione lyase